MAESNRIEKLFEQFNQQITQMAQTLAQQFQQTLTAVIQYGKNAELGDVVLDLKEEKNHETQLQIQQDDGLIVPEVGDHEGFQKKIAGPSLLIHHHPDPLIHDKPMYNDSGGSTGIPLFEGAQVNLAPVSHTIPLTTPLWQCHTLVGLIQPTIEVKLNEEGHQSQLQSRQNDDPVGPEVGDPKWGHAGVQNYSHLQPDNDDQMNHFEANSLSLSEFPADNFERGEFSANLNGLSVASKVFDEISKRELHYNCQTNIKRINQSRAAKGRNSKNASIYVLHGVHNMMGVQKFPSNDVKAQNYRTTLKQQDYMVPRSLRCEFDECDYISIAKFNIVYNHGWFLEDFIKTLWFGLHVLPNIFQIGYNHSKGNISYGGINHMRDNCLSYSNICTGLGMTRDLHELLSSKGYVVEFLVKGLDPIPHIKTISFGDVLEHNSTAYLNKCDGNVADSRVLTGRIYLIWWTKVDDAISNMGLFQRKMSSDTFQFIGMREVNPFTLVNEHSYHLDMRGELDGTAAFNNFIKWPFGRVMSPMESCIHGLEEKTSASLKFTAPIPKGRIWTTVVGGGANVIYADTVGDLGYAAELGNYVKYSGAPNEEEVLQYIRVVIDCVAAEPDGCKRALVVGGGITSFIDVAATFNGIIRALKEKESKLKATNMHIYMRRGGPNYQRGLEKMMTLTEEIGIPIEVTILDPDPWCMPYLFIVDINSLCKRYQIIKGIVDVGVSSGANGEVKEVYIGDSSVPIADMVVIHFENKQLMKLFKRLESLLLMCSFQEEGTFIKVAEEYHLYLGLQVVSNLNDELENEKDDIQCLLEEEKRTVGKVRLFMIVRDFVKMVEKVCMDVKVKNGDSPKILLITKKDRVYVCAIRIIFEHKVRFQAIRDDELLKSNDNVVVIFGGHFSYLWSEYGNTIAVARVFAFLYGPPDYRVGQLDTKRHTSELPWVILASLE